MIIDKNRPAAFLDLCGVVSDTWLVHNRDIRPHLNPGMFHTTQYYRGDIAVKAAKELLVAILNQYKVQVIVVSSWVKSDLFPDDPDIVALREYLEFDDILGSLTTSGGVWRSERIKEFVTTNDITKWVVVDDSRDQMYPDRVFFNDDRFVHPHGRYGFWQKEAEQLDTILRSMVHDDVCHTG